MGLGPGGIGSFPEATNVAMTFMKHILRRGKVGQILNE